MTRSDPVGRVVNGRYRLTRLLGEGGMGSVYEGEHIEVGRKVAIKLVHAAHVGNPEVVARLKQEARATGVIESENIVQVLDAGEDPSEGLFVVMELLRGENLESLLQRQKQLEPPAAAMVATQAARGLMRAHAQGIVHRDLKPANVVLCEREDKTPLVKLVDFGIAKLVRDANGAAGAEGGGSKLTRVGGVVGTPQYMAPEQAQGLDSVDARTDVYALGALIYEMVVGKPPVPDTWTYEQKIVFIVTQPAPRIRAAVPDVDERLDQLVADMMANAQDARPADMQQVIMRLAEIFSPAEIAPSSFSGAQLQPLIARTGAVPKAAGPTPPSSEPRVTGLPFRQLAPTEVGVAIDRRTLLQDVTPDGVPQGSRTKVILGVVASILVVAAIVVFKIVGSSAPAEQTGLVQSVAAPASGLSTSVATSIPPVESIAPTSTPPVKVASATATAPITARTAAAPATSLTLPMLPLKDAGAPSATARTDAGPPLRVFGGAGISPDF